METKPTLDNIQLPSQQQPVASQEEEPESMSQFGLVDVLEAHKFEGEENKSVVTGVSLPSVAAPAPRSHAPSVAARSALSMCRERKGQATAAGKRRKRNKDDFRVQQPGRVSRALEVTRPMDHHELFAMSLVSLMRLVSADKQLKMRIELLRVIEKYMD